MNRMSGALSCSAMCTPCAALVAPGAAAGDETDAGPAGEPAGGHPP